MWLKWQSQLTHSFVEKETATWIVKTIVNKTWHFLISEHTKNQYNQQSAMTYWQTHENQWNKTTQKETPA